MILTVTPNPAWDVTYRADRLVAGQSHRVRVEGQRAGGKGINVARILAGRGVPAVALAPAGGRTGEQLAADLDAGRVPQALVRIAGTTRTTVAVVAPDGNGRLDATLFNEEGPTLTDAEWHALLDEVDRLLPSASVLVCAGSLPPGLPPSAPAELVSLAAAAGRPAVVDVGGEPLLLAAAAGAAVVKPNAAELAAALGSPSPPREGAEALRRVGADAAVVSAGEAGLVAATPDGVWAARPVAPIAGNPTGAGDAVVAALAHGLEAGLSWPARLELAGAWAAAAVASNVAGDLDEATLDSAAAAVRLERLGD
ncbi:MAG TPA: hexose kinase [Acidimicrobiales bacterium]|nr:hexose kinase [Acidimicrobiales bacterium]